MQAALEEQEEAIRAKRHFLEVFAEMDRKACEFYALTCTTSPSFDDIKAR